MDDGKRVDKRGAEVKPSFLGQSQLQRQYQYQVGKAPIHNIIMEFNAFTIADSEYSSFHAS